jgi:hypothetical protein
MIKECEVHLGSIDDPTLAEEILCTGADGDDLVRIRFMDGVAVLASNWGELIKGSRQTAKSRKELLDVAAYLGLQVLHNYGYDTEQAIEHHYKDIRAGIAARKAGVK